jgi:hypothetical protein
MYFERFGLRKCSDVVKIVFWVRNVLEAYLFVKTQTNMVEWSLFRIVIYLFLFRIVFKSSKRLLEVLKIFEKKRGSFGILPSKHAKALQRQNAGRS